jgi:predicted porin
MNQKVLTFAVAAALMAPMATYADVKLSGTIQAEIGGARFGEVNGEEADTLRVSKDSQGALANGGPNKITFDIDEKLGNGISAEARYQAAFNTAANDGLTDGREAWVGLGTSNFHFRFGQFTSGYKATKGLIDPFANTSIQARGTAGGMTGSKRLDIQQSDAGNIGGYTFDPEVGLRRVRASDGPDIATVDLETVVSGTNHSGLVHSGYLSNALQLGLEFGGEGGKFIGTFQGVFDETDEMDGAGVIDLRYQAPNFTIFLAGAFLDFEGGVGDVGGNITDSITNDDDEEDDDDNAGNWKIGGQFKMGPATLGLQYEDAELGALDPNPSGGEYIMASVDYAVNQSLLLGGWVAGYLSDIEDSHKWRIDGEMVEEDAVSFSVGFKYLFSKRTLVFGGYNQVDSDNDYRDQQVYGIGIRHSF